MEQRSQSNLQERWNETTKPLGTVWRQWIPFTQDGCETKPGPETLIGVLRHYRSSSQALVGPSLSTGVNLTWQHAGQCHSQPVSPDWEPHVLAEHTLHGELESLSFCHNPQPPHPRHSYLCHQKSPRMAAPTSHLTAVIKYENTYKRSLETLNCFRRGK